MKTDIGEPIFETSLVPVKSKSKFLINAEIKIGSANFPLTTLSVGNPHTVLFVDDFDFDWETLGAEIERLPIFPKRTNVEFVKILKRNKIFLSGWERGAGATGSSGTGAAAAVAAGVMNGQLERKCEVEFDTGSLNVNWRNSDNIIELTGPVEFIGEGYIEL